MKRFTSMLALIGLLFVGACNTKVTPGYVGILVSTTGSQKDAKDFPIQRGRIWHNPFTEDVYTFPTFVQNITWTANKEEGSGVDESITFNSVENAAINVDVALAYSFQPDKVPAIFVRFRQDAETITKGYMRNKVRAAFSAVGSTQKVGDISGAGKQAFLAEVKKKLNDELGPEGFQFDMVDFISNPRLPKNVQEAINASLQATQDAQTAENKLRKTQAEAQMLIAQREGEAKAAIIAAEGEAKANALRQASLSPAILQQQAIAKWDGKFPQVISSGNQLLNLVLRDK